MMARQLQNDGLAYGIKASIFGDPLGNRGEYSKGIFYSGRRKYLYDEKRQLSPMEPPRDMMTNKQVWCSLEPLSEIPPPPLLTTG